MANKQQLEEILTPSVEALGCTIWHCELASMGQQKILRLLIEAENGVSADACAKVSRQVAALLDVEELINGRYTLEVSSPGMDRPLVKPEHFQCYLGRNIKCKLRMAVDGRRKLTGELQGCDDAQIQLKTEDGVYDIQLSNIDKANLIPDF